MDKKQKWYKKMPHTYVILFLLIVLAAILTHVLQAGEFDRVTVEGLWKPVVVPGSYHTVEQQGAGFFDIFKSIPDGMVAASSIIFMIMISSAVFNIINSTGALEASIAVFLNKLRKTGFSQTVIIWIVTYLFAALGIFIGPEILIPFTIIGVNIALGLGLDVVVGLGLVMGGGYVGWNFSPINVSIVGLSHSVTGLPMFSGMEYRLITVVIATAIVATIVSLYANKIAKDPSKSLVNGMSLEGLGMSKDLSEYKASGTQLTILLVMVAMFGITIYGAMKWRWYLQEMSTSFLIGGLVIGIIARYKVDKIIKLIMEGVSRAASIAIILGIARGIQIILEKGMIMDTIINALASPLQGVGPTVGAILMSIITAVVHFFIPSGSSLAVALMPILSPLGTILDISQQTVVLAFQFGATIPNFIYPTVGATMAMIGIARVPIDKWMKIGLKLTFLLFVMAWVLLAVAVAIGY